MAGEIISERRATSNRNAGRHHRGFASDFPRNPHLGSQNCSNRRSSVNVGAVIRHALSEEVEREPPHDLPLPIPRNPVTKASTGPDHSPNGVPSLGSRYGLVEVLI